MDKFFLLITEFGGETFAYIFLFISIWCMDKKFGRFFVILNFLSLNTNILLKNIFCVPRPWVKDPDFTVVKDAIPTATGYSFPSGHTANALSIFGSLFIWFKNNLTRSIVSILLILVSISRMYLGVHTIYDVSASWLLGILIIYFVRSYLKLSKSEFAYFHLITLALIYSLLTVLVLEYMTRSSVVDFELSYDGLKNAYSIFGLSLGYLIAYFIDERYIKYDTKATIYVQVLKVILGALITFIINEGLKTIFELLMPNIMLANSFRFFVVALFVAIIWPMTFKCFNRLELYIRSRKNAKS